MNMRNGTLENGALLDTNLDTTFLKVVAVISMFLDHVGGTFFPEYPVFRWIGRLAFPIFCYCMTVGMLYTRDIKRYLGRIAVFAVISQPFWILAFNPHDFLGNLTNWNIFLLCLLVFWLCGVLRRKNGGFLQFLPLLSVFGILIILLPEFSLCLFFIFAGKNRYWGLFCIR